MPLDELHNSCSLFVRTASTAGKLVNNEDTSVRGATHKDYEPRFSN
jgi:hypothetical protein